MVGWVDEWVAGWSSGEDLVGGGERLSLVGCSMSRHVARWTCWIGCWLRQQDSRSSDFSLSLNVLWCCEAHCSCTLLPAFSFIHPCIHPPMHPLTHAFTQSCIHSSMQLLHHMRTDIHSSSRCSHSFCPCYPWLFCA